MMTRTRLLITCVVLFSGTLPVLAQRTADAVSAVPRLVPYSGKVVDAQGEPRLGVAGVTFAIYKDEEGGAPLWMEVQNVQADKTGHYTTQLGATTPGGLPMELFGAGEPRWLGVQISGEAEQPRTQILSVPYALKALDAETLGGQPASVFLQALSRQNVEQAAAVKAIASSAAATPPPVLGTGTPRFVPLWTATNTIGNSTLFEDVKGSIGLGTTTPVAAFDVKGDIHAAGNVGASTVQALSSGQAVAAQMTGNLDNTGAVVGTATATGTGQTIGVKGVAATSGGAGVAGINSASGYGVTGTATGASGQGVRGESFGTQQSNGFGPDGVQGFAHSNNASGVAGFNSAPGGTGVYGSGDWGFFTPSNVHQDFSAGGWVKAMVLYRGFDNTILKCFNSAITGAASLTPPCGISVNKLRTGEFFFNFGFPIADRFFSVTSMTGEGNDNAICTATNGGFCPSGQTLDGNTVEFSFRTSTGTLLIPYDPTVYLIVF